MNGGSNSVSERPKWRIWTVCSYYIYREHATGGSWPEKCVERGFVALPRSSIASSSHAGSQHQQVSSTWRWRAGSSGRSTFMKLKKTLQNAYLGGTGNATQIPRFFSIRWETP
jgi:hypothetical protein